MAYTTINDIFKRYPMVSNIVGSGPDQIASLDVSSVYISDAESIVNAYLSRRYTIPLTAEPIITMVAADITIYRMFEDRLPRFPQAIEKRYTNAMSIVYMLQLGKMDLTSSNIISNTGDQYAWSSAGSFAGSIFAPAEQLTNCQSVTDPLLWLDRDTGGGDGFTRSDSP